MSAERTGSRIVVHSDVPGGAFRAVSVAIVSKKTSARGEPEADQQLSRHLCICMSRSIGIMFWLR